MIWAFLAQSKTSCTVFSEGTSPDYYGDLGYGVPGRREFDFTKADSLDKDLDDHYRDCSMEVKELSDEEWAEHEKRVTLDL